MFWKENNSKILQNIKNWKSQRWQALLNVRARRRLLLTGKRFLEHRFLKQSKFIFANQIVIESFDFCANLIFR